MSHAVIELGASHPVAWSFQIPLQMQVQARVSARNDTVPTSLHLFGYVIYEDARKVRRTTAICRQWVAMSNRFVAVETGDYERID
jgi:hypothetical protein